jgi:hypothetical protein
LFPVSFRDSFGRETVIDVGLGNPNSGAYPVVFPEPMSVVDSTLQAISRDPTSRVYSALADFVRRNGVLDIHRMNPTAVVKLTRNAFVRQQLVMGRPIQLFGAHWLYFDGKSLELRNATGRVRAWSGVSGQPGFQGSEHQETKDTGPLPEGVWLARQSRFERIGVYGSIAGLSGRGTWPGSTAAWGRFRIWLEPVGDTRTHGRSGFSIHGGLTPGSAGCIDLTSNVDDFARHFLSYGRDLTLTVSYPAPPAPLKPASK